MAKIEVEYRGVLTKEKFQKLSAFLKEKGEFVKEKDRFSVIYFPRGKERLKVSNDARKEFSFPVESEKFEEVTEFLKIVGFYYGVLQATKTYVYMYEDIEFALVEVPGWGYYFEAEILTKANAIKNANKKIKSVCGEFGLDILNDKDFYKLLEDLSNRPGFRFNFKKEAFSDIKKRFITGCPKTQ